MKRKLFGWCSFYGVLAYQNIARTPWHHSFSAQQWENRLDRPKFVQL